MFCSITNLLPSLGNWKILEREREGERKRRNGNCLCLCVGVQSAVALMRPHFNCRNFGT
jgi:hypothetical protein